MKQKRKSTWMVGFVLPPRSTPLQLAQCEARAQIADKAVRNRVLRTVK